MRILKLAICLCACAFAAAGGTAVQDVALQKALEEYVDGKDATIGVAVIVDGKEVVAVNGDRQFPMLSVYKFPQALSVVGRVSQLGMSLGDSIDIAGHEIKSNTWSPMREKYGVADVRLPLRELLAYSVQQSDNNACDVLFRWLGGPHVVGDYLTSIGFDGSDVGIHVVSTEDEMHRDLSLCYENSSSPLAMARLMDSFAGSLAASSAEMTELGHLLEGCVTGTDRLPVPLAGVGAVIGHKTGTGDRNAAGRIIGVNDVGYVRLPDGRRYTVAVFICDSAASLPDTSAMIGEISTIVYDAITGGSGMPYSGIICRWLELRPVHSAGTGLSESLPQLPVQVSR